MYQAYEIMAWIHLEDNNEPKAIEDAKAALEISPNGALKAMSIMATIEQLNDRPGKEWLDKILQARSNYGEAYETMGHFFSINRRYDEGIAAYRKALDLKPDLWTARAQLGVELMRFGHEDEARVQLEKTFNEGPVPSQIIVRNSLKLLDSYANFETTTTPRTILKLHKKEAALLRPYVQAEFEKALETYEKKYKFKLDEIDFAVLRNLQEHARISNVELADRVGLSPAPCLRRVQALERSGVIKKYVALLNPSAVAREVTV